MSRDVGVLFIYYKELVMKKKILLGLALGVLMSNSAYAGVSTTYSSWQFIKAVQQSPRDNFMVCTWQRYRIFNLNWNTKELETAYSYSRMAYSASCPPPSM